MRMCATFAAHLVALLRCTRTRRVGTDPISALAAHVVRGGVADGVAALTSTCQLLELRLVLLQEKPLQHFEP